MSRMMVGGGGFGTSRAVHFNSAAVCCADRMLGSCSCGVGGMKGGRSRRLALVLSSSMERALGLRCLSYLVHSAYWGRWDFHALSALRVHGIQEILVRA